ncbi:MAG TPA: hypothetical protein P5137_13580 [Candidatus Brocadiia bacterium]|nr:hypothetical protein [Candidatus Brocadiia bacterium]
MKSGFVCAWVAALALLAGCAAGPERMASWVGKPEADVVRTFGQANSVTKGEGGTKTLVYELTRTEMRQVPGPAPRPGQNMPVEMGMVKQTMTERMVFALDKDGRVVEATREVY